MTTILKTIVIIAVWQLQQTECRDLEFNLKNIIPSTYIKEQRPEPGDGKPVEVNVSMFINDIGSIGAGDMAFTVDLLLTQSWVERRLNISKEALEDDADYLLLPADALNDLWHPQPYISNAKSVSVASMMDKFGSFIVYYNKTVISSIRLSLLLGCQMEFRQFPVDIQECFLTLESFTYDEKKVAFYWVENDPVLLNPSLKLLQFALLVPIQTESNIVDYRDRPGRYIQLKAWLRFQRYLGYHLIQVFFPTFIIVTLSWFSFYMGLDAVPGRVTMLVTTFLALVTMFSGLRADLPAVSYIKALDIWMAMCMLFVFAAIAEFVIVKYLDHMNKSAPIPPSHVPFPERLSLLGSRMGKWPPVGVSVYPGNHPPEAVQMFRRQGPLFLPQHVPKTNYSSDRHRLILRIECKSKFVFPMAFAVFVLVYWPLLLYRKI